MQKLISAPLGKLCCPCNCRCYTRIQSYHETLHTLFIFAAQRMELALQESEAAGPLLTPTPGVQSLLKLFLCDPGSAPLHRLLKQLRPSFQAIFTPIPQTLSSHVSVLAHVHLATLPAGTPPRMALKASQVGPLHNVSPFSNLPRPVKGASQQTLSKPIMRTGCITMPGRLGFHGRAR